MCGGDKNAIGWTQKVVFSIIGISLSKPYTTASGRVRCQSSDTIIKSDTTELFAIVVLETLMLSTFRVGVNPIRSVLFWVIPIKT